MLSNTVKNKFLKGTISLVFIAIALIGTSALFLFNFYNSKVSDIITESSKASISNLQDATNRSIVEISSNLENELKKRIKSNVSRDVAVAESLLKDNAFLSIKRQLAKNYSLDQDLIYVNLFKDEGEKLTSYAAVNETYPDGIIGPGRFNIKNSRWTYRGFNKFIKDEELKYSSNLKGLSLEKVGNSYFDVYALVENKKSFDGRYVLNYRFSLDNFKKLIADRRVRINQALEIQKEQFSRQSAKISSQSENVRQFSIIFSFVLSVVVLALSTLVSFKISKNFTQPIDELVQVTKTVADGDLTKKVEVSGPVEITNLSNSFNRMVENIKERDEKLVEQNKELEYKVKERTKEIQIKNDELSTKLDEVVNLQDRLVAQEKLASLGALTAGVAHEIKNPLNIIMNSSHMLNKVLDVFKGYFEQNPPTEFHNSDIDKKLRNLDKVSQLIIVHGKRIDRIVKAMLSHGTTKDTEQTEVDLKEFVTRAVNLSYHAMRAKDPIEIQVNFDIDSVGVIDAYSTDLNRALIHIVDNSFDSMKEKLEKSSNIEYIPSLSVSLKSENDFNVIKIRDNGVGIDKEVESKVFEPFVTTKDPGNGTGLGLSFVYDVISAHSGTIDMKNNQDDGVEFIVKIPVKDNKEKAVA